MNRAPQYTRDRLYRIISVPNNLWQLQKWDGTPGTRERDPWLKRSQEVNLGEAQALLRSCEPAKAQVQA